MVLMWSPPEGFECRPIKSFDGVELNVCSNFWGRHVEGRVAVLLHGSPGQVSNWRFQVDYLVKRGHPVIVYDQRGYGRSGKPKEVCLEDYLRDLSAVLRALSVEDRQAVLAGHSFGTMVALPYAVTHDVPALCLVGPVLKLRTDFTDWIIQHFPPAIWKRLFFTENFLTRRMYRNLFFSRETPDEVYEEFIRNNRDYLESLPPHTFKYLYRMLDYDATKYAPKVRANTTILVGEEDKVTPPEESRKLHELIPNSKLLVVKGAGHMILYEKPDIVNKEIEGYLVKP